MNSDLRIVPLSRGKPEIKRFWRVPFRLYRDDPNWVAPLSMELAQVLGDRNPFFEHAELQMYVAVRDGSDVGRIAAIIDRSHNQIHAEPVAFFGFFEAVNDPGVCSALLGAVRDWARRRGIRSLLGPCSPSTNDECGLLVEGFDTPPLLMMPYNPPYYESLLVGEGFVKAKDLYAFHFEIGPEPMARLDRAAGIFESRQKDIRVRPVRRKSLEADLQKIKEVYNAAWEQNWGFVPMTDAEINFMAERLKPLVVEDLLQLAETPTEPVAFLLAMPDFFEVLHRLKGSFATPRILSALPYLLGWKHPRQLRLITFGIKKPYRRRGIEAVMFRAGLQYALKAGYRGCECSWILEDNLGVQRLIELFGGRRYKTYRIYSMPL